MGETEVLGVPGFRGIEIGHRDSDVVDADDEVADEAVGEVLMV